MLHNTIVICSLIGLSSPSMPSRAPERNNHYTRRFYLNSAIGGLLSGCQLFRFCRSVRLQHDQHIMVPCDAYASLSVVRVRLSLLGIPENDPIEPSSPLWSVPYVCADFYYRPVCSARSRGGRGMWVFLFRTS